MSLRNEPDSWQLSSTEHYLPISHQGTTAGFLKEEYAAEITKLLNDETMLKKALKLACIDLVKQSGGDPSQVKVMIKKYLKMVEIPKYGTKAIAILLKERQQELDLGEREFVKFCDSFKLPPSELSKIYAGGNIDDSFISPLSRILGVSKSRLFEIRDGSEERDI
jgi:hypothetical protein